MKKQHPTPKQTTTTRRQRAFGDSLRAWLQDRGTKAEKQRKKDARKVKGRRGVDRVPARLRVTPPALEWHYQHAPKWSENGRYQKGQPFMDPERRERKLKPGTTNAARRRAARIRQELR